jgi:hypothetical protein
MKKIVITCWIMMLVITACSPILPSSKGKCGDGTCSGPENGSTCPADCGEPASSGSEQPQANSSDTRSPLLIGFMVHLEGWNDDANQAQFNQHAAIVREYASLFETYGAKITFESKELTDGAIKWGDNVLLEMQQRGHGVGVHADEGGDRDYDECAGFAEVLLEKKSKLESLGVTVLHVSGVVSKCDWVSPTVEAGFKFTTGTVSYGAMSLSPELQPADYSNCTVPSKCHDVFPTDLEDRIHPWRAENGSNWTQDNPNGDLVILSASQGLTCMSEELKPTGKTGNCVFEQSDIESYLQQMQLALTLSEPGKTNIFYVGNSLGTKLDMDLLEAWLQAIDPYVKSGQVEWVTLPEMYQAYVANGNK